MMKIPTAVIIIIGNEILSGRTVDKNIAYIAARLNDLGIKLKHVHIIGDVSETIIALVRQCHQQYDYVFTTGGIGPTHDDITAQAMADAFETTLESHPQAVALLRNHYGEENLTAARLRMALIPKGASLIANVASVAPGFCIKNVYVMAGVPDIARAMFDEIATELKPGPKVYSQTVHCMLGESMIADELRLIQTQYPTVDIGSYPYFKNRTYGLSLVFRGINEENVTKAAQEVIALIQVKGGIPEYQH